MLILVIIGYTVLAVYEFVPLYSKKQWRDFWVNIGVGLFSMVIAVMLSLNVKIPSPADPIKEIITFMFGK
ncbi:MAG: hypothetical protein GX660_04080 [Clostridiaceae bacterium]|nr:hypothetical protein [Clostridiaceae bacterium]